MTFLLPLPNYFDNSSIQIYYIIKYKCLLLYFLLWNKQIGVLKKNLIIYKNYHIFSVNLV